MAAFILATLSPSIGGVFAKSADINLASLISTTFSKDSDLITEAFVLKLSTLLLSFVKFLLMLLNIL